MYAKKTSHFKSLPIAERPFVTMLIWKKFRIVSILNFFPSIPIETIPKI